MSELSLALDTFGDITLRADGSRSSDAQTIRDIVDEAVRLLDDRAAYDAMSHAVNPYGDGKAAARIIQAILYHYGLADGRPDVFEG